ncbi:glycosyltransferase family 4 protein [uncultured Thiobacillus sp.]|uniref:glycosyltransferase family 4 protein n=1 Tax=uncultured Thiobacillus sp. TaxID=189996 RepID=UPI00086D8CD3|nr:glycosyltransferase family 4 protein [uncultured Thiobacillus sp.]ODU31809.1 MAG: hypothetical protein ABS93_00525 [Thiobacillus sp. SCN 62-729]
MIYFYPHPYLRDRQLDTIRHWPGNEVLNPEIAQNRKGAQVSKGRAISTKNKRSWKQIFPLINIKLRPNAAPKDAVVYLWGGLIATGQFIVDIDNPWSLVGYNIGAMPLYRWIIERILLSQRCLEIRCMSVACRQSLFELFGESVYRKATVHYPTAGIVLVSGIKASTKSPCRFLFIGSQFEIKGGAAMLAAFKAAQKSNPEITLEVITHLPASFVDEASQISGLTVHAPEFSRFEIFEHMKNADVLLHPSYMESFGMTILEAMAHGLAIVANDIYAIREMVVNGENGFLLRAPISKWEGALPNQNFMKKNEYLNAIRELDNEEYVGDLTRVIVELASNAELANKMKINSLRRFQEMNSNNG